MDAERIATIRRYADQHLPLPHWEVKELCDALEAAQAENTRLRERLEHPEYGAWQFDQRTWDSNAAAIGRNDLVGVDPASASPADQDAVALTTYQSRLTDEANQQLLSYGMMAKSIAARLLQEAERLEVENTRLQRGVPVIRTESRYPRSWIQDRENLANFLPAHEHELCDGCLADVELRDRLASQVTDLTSRLEALTGTEHIVEVTEDGWGLQHPYSCRPHLLACRVHQIVDLDGPLVDECGIYTVTLTEDEREVVYVAALSPTEEPQT